MLSYEESLKILKETNALLEGHFILSSGLHTNKYIQCAQLLSHPGKAEKICESLTDKISKTFNKIDLILSPAIGGMIIGYEIGRRLKKNTIFAERVNKIFNLRRGFVIKPDSKVLIVEDVITTGKSSLECTEIVKKNKANLIGYACLIDRTNEKSLIKDNIVSQLKLNILTYKAENIPDDLKKISPIKPGSRNL
tara:strand:+ start:694 stop:1275 length:582 start_codon:yes stop_codon:yes gene_type:complete